jgi:hypothetical protein
MNIWEAEHRQWLRKMNAIWNTYGHLYLTDDWKPFVPVQSRNVIASLWDHGDQMIINLVDTASSSTTLKWEVPANNRFRYFDIWNGAELMPFAENGKHWISVPVNHFGAILRTNSPSDVFDRIAGRAAQGNHHTSSRHRPL